MANETDDVPDKPPMCGECDCFNFLEDPNTVCSVPRCDACCDRLCGLDCSRQEDLYIVAHVRTLGAT